MSATAEKYARAVNTSNLEWTSTEQTAVDTIAAAGMAGESLGMALLRLQSEYDSIAGSPLQRLMMSRLRSMKNVRSRVIHIVVCKAKERAIALNDAMACEIASGLIDIFLAPTCETCDGRGSLGGYGSPYAICATCDGSKRRKLTWPYGKEHVAAMAGREIEQATQNAKGRLQVQLTRLHIKD